MKRIITLLLAAAALFLSACAASVTNTGSPGNSPAEKTSSSFSPTAVSDTTSPENDDALTWRISNGRLLVDLHLPESAGKPVSLLLLTDEKHKSDWDVTPGALIDLDEVTLNEEGKGQASLTLPQDGTAAYLIVTAPDEEIIRRVQP